MCVKNKFAFFRAICINRYMANSNNIASVKLVLYIDGEPHDLCTDVINDPSFSRDQITHMTRVKFLINQLLACMREYPMMMELDYETRVSDMVFFLCDAQICSSLYKTASNNLYSLNQKLSDISNDNKIQLEVRLGLSNDEGYGLYVETSWEKDAVSEIKAALEKYQN